MLTGYELRHLRLDAELQQQDVARAAGLERWRLSQIEHGLQGRPLSMQEERAIRRAITRLLAVERQRKALLSPDPQGKRIRRPHPKPESDGAASGNASADTLPETEPEVVPDREEGVTDPVSAR